MKLSDFDYHLPPELIAQTPLADRAGSRLLHLPPAYPGRSGLEHRRFRDLPELIEPGDLLVFNDSRVYPARLHGRSESGADVEALLLDHRDRNPFRVLTRPARKLRPGTRLRFGVGTEHEVEAEVIAIGEGGERSLRFAYAGDWDQLWEQIGTTPLPPYIKARGEESEVRARYQTLYARERGSIAAPTAGLHFTEEILAALEARGVRRCSLSLDVGYATFQPIRPSDDGGIESHRMGREHFRLPEETVAAIDETRAAGGRVLAVGTTTVRALETAAAGGSELTTGWGTSELFITPGFRFRVVDGMLTNFHLPRSTLLLLVSALAGRDRVLDAYREAVRLRYRFYSFGDCMLVFPGSP